MALSASAAQAAPAYQVYPVRGLFFPGTDRASLISDDFRQSEAVDGGAYFEKKFREAFPDAATTITESNKRRTFAVSLQIARASFYTVPKPPTGTVDVYLPMTASLYFTNVMTGEVLFAATQTDLPLGTIMETDVSAAGRPRVRGLFAQYFRALVDELIADARATFKPSTTTATVRAEWKGLAILDKGDQAGVAIDDSFVDDQGNELRVVSVGSTYAVAHPELGQFSKGGTFSRASNMTLAEIHKPRVLPFIDESPAELPAEALLQIFSDALGTKSPVSLVPVNRDFADVLKTVATHAEISQEQLRQRELPDFFLRLHVYDPITFETPTTKGYRKRRITEALALAEIQDRGGHVLFATWGRDRVQDEIVNGIALNVANRREIVVKNALIELAKKLGDGFRVKRLELPVTEGSASSISVRDDNGALTPQSSIQIMHSIGSVSGIPDEVRVVTWDAEIFEAGSVAHGRPLLETAQGVPPPEKGDVVVFEGTGLKSARVRLGPCGGVEKLGAMDLPGYEPLMLNLFAAGSPAPFYAAGLAAHVNELLSAGCGFKTDLAFKEPQSDRCVQVVHRIGAAAQSCSDGECADNLTVRLTYRVRKGPGGDVTTKHGLESHMRATALPAATPSADRALSVQADLVDEALQLGPQIVAAFAGEAL